MLLSLLADGDLNACLLDLQIIREKLPTLHFQFDTVVSPHEWANKCDDTGTALPAASPAARRLLLMKLVAQLGVAHTLVAPGPANYGSPSVQWAPYADGSFVTASSDPALLEAQVLRVGKVSVRAAIHELSRFIPSENAGWRDAQLPQITRLHAAYRAAGLADPDGTVRMQLRLKDGAKKWVKVTSTPAALSRIASDRFPDYYRPQTRNYEIREAALPGTKAIVFDYRRCQSDLKDPIAPVIEEFWKRYDHGNAVAIVDLRRNGGGNSSVLWPLYSGIRKRPGIKLFALTSRHTFSSAVSNATELRALGAKLIGEPTGGDPNGFGEVKNILLPNTGSTLYYCTKKWSRTKTRYRALEPDVQSPIRFQDLAAGIDPIWSRIPL